MYSDSDLDDAVKAGLIDARAANAIRNMVAARRQSPAADEEFLKLLNSFNDIFVSVALLLFLVGLWGFAGVSGGSPVIGGAIAAVATWLLGGPLTTRRRMAFPSIILLLAFVGSVAAIALGLANRIFDESSQTALGLTVAYTAIVAVIAATVHWLRYKVPITLAVIVLLVGAVLLGTALTVFPGEQRAVISVLAVALGLVTFAIAMWWDVSDIYRQTRRSDIAFWLHLLAGALIVHGVFSALGIGFGKTLSAPSLAVMAVLVALFTIVALAVDRRALLVSSIGYVLSALVQLTGAVGTSGMAGALVLGVAMLLLATHWTELRQKLLVRLSPQLRAQLPRAELEIRRVRPVA